MRIFYLISSLKLGGAEKALLGLVPEIEKKGHTVCVAFFHDGPIKEGLQKAGITTAPIHGLVSCYDPVSGIRLLRSIRRFKPDLIHTSLWSANVIGRLMGRLLGIPVISDLHGNCQFEGRLRNLGDRLTAPLTAANVAVSVHVGQAYNKLLGNPETSPYAPLVIPNGIDVATCHGLATRSTLTRTSLGIPATAFVIGSLGRLEPIKGYDLLLEAFALLADRPERPAVLCLVGDGSCRTLLEAKAQQLGVAGRVLFIGAQANPYPFYPLFDCFALSSHSEGLSMALLEAMSFGLPVVTTHTQDTHDVIDHEKNGIIVTTRIPSDYMRALEQVYLNSSYGKKLGAASRTMVKKGYSLERMAASYHALYTKIKFSN